MIQKDLKQSVLNSRETLFQGIAASAPAGAAVATMTGAAAYALGALPMAALIAFFVVLLNAYIIKRISARVAGSGGYYDYTKIAYGPVVGAFTGWMYLLYQIFAMTFVAMSISVFVPALLSDVFLVSLPSYSWVPLLAGTLIIAYSLSVVGIKPSLKYAMIMGTVEIAVVIAIGAVIILSHPAINTISVFTPKFAYGGLSGVMLGVIFMYTAFSGFGNMTPLGEETMDAKNTIGRMVIYSAIILGLFFVFTAYAFTVGWGPGNMLSYSTNLVPGIILAKGDLGIVGALILTVFYINSIIWCLTVFFNSSSRITLSLARNNVLPSFLAAIHPTRRTPHVSAAIMGVIAFIIASIGTVVLGGGGFNMFLVAGVVSTLPALLVHAIANSSLPVLNKRATDKYGILNIILPLAAIVILAFVFYGTFISINREVIIASLVFIVWVFFGIIASVLRRSSYVIDERFVEAASGEK